MKDQLEKWLLDTGAVYRNDEDKLIPIKNIYTNDVLEFIESLSVEPKAESVEGLKEIVANIMAQFHALRKEVGTEENNIHFQKVQNSICDLADLVVTLPSVKPVMPEEMPIFLDALIARHTLFNSYKDRQKFYGEIRTALMNSGDKDKVNE